MTSRAAESAYCWWRLEDLAAVPEMAAEICAVSGLRSPDECRSADWVAWGGEVGRVNSHVGGGRSAGHEWTWDSLAFTAATDLDRWVLAEARRLCRLFGYLNC